MCRAVDKAQGEFMPEVAAEVGDLLVLVCPDAGSLEARDTLQRAMNSTEQPHHLTGLLKQFPTHGKDVLKIAEATMQKFGVFTLWSDRVKANIELLQQLCEKKIVDRAAVASFVDAVLCFRDATDMQLVEFKQYYPDDEHKFQDVEAKVARTRTLAYFKKLLGCG